MLIMLLSYYFIKFNFVEKQRVTIKNGETWLTIYKKDGSKVANDLI